MTVKDVILVLKKLVKEGKGDFNVEVPIYYVYADGKAYYKDVTTIVVRETALGQVTIE